MQTSNLDYTGEGSTPKSSWSSKEPVLSMTLWNSRSLTYERFYYYKILNYDVLVLTELWRSDHKFVDGTIRWTHSKTRLDEDGKSIYPKDSSAGGDILLSDRAQSKYLGHGSSCERITWLQLKDPVTNIFVIAIYVPHSLQKSTKGS